uniref:Uncharacterized protein n=1 Tax=Polytomella parva TaxID=51329 RepID=A0A7S0UPM5_9CHLO|mmetsp:Transcript_13377/g.23692  ORF Transcript_13377/g.23692 Transcript_13377/m.23692 type:complete len:1993 (+) Transcript_13377:160-6138(+)
MSIVRDSDSDYNPLDDEDAPKVRQGVRSRGRGSIKKAKSSRAKLQTPEKKPKGKRKVNIPQKTKNNPSLVDKDLPKKASKYYPGFCADDDADFCRDFEINDDYDDDDDDAGFGSEVGGVSSHYRVTTGEGSEGSDKEEPDDAYISDGVGESARFTDFDSDEDASHNHPDEFSFEHPLALLEAMEAGSNAANKSGIQPYQLLKDIRGAARRVQHRRQRALMTGSRNHRHSHDDEAYEYDEDMEGRRVRIEPSYDDGLLSDLEQDDDTYEEHVYAFPSSHRGRGTSRRGSGRGRGRGRVRPSFAPPHESVNGNDAYDEEEIDHVLPFLTPGILGVMEGSETLLGSLGEGRNDRVGGRGPSRRFVRNEGLSAETGSVKSRRKAISRASNNGRGRGRGRPKGHVTRQELPEDLHKLLGEAHIRFAQSDYAGAIPLLREVIQQRPHVVDPYHTLALCHESLGDERAALDLYMLVAHLRRRDPDVWRHLAIKSIDFGFLRQAIYCLTKVLRKTKGQDLEAAWNRAHLLAQVGEESRAMHDLLKFARIRPGDPALVKTLARIHHQSGHHELAERLLERHLRVPLGDIAIFRQRARETMTNAERRGNHDGNKERYDEEYESEVNLDEFNEFDRSEDEEGTNGKDGQNNSNQRGKGGVNLPLGPHKTNKTNELEKSEEEEGKENGKRGKSDNKDNDNQAYNSLAIFDTSSTTPSHSSRHYEGMNGATAAERKRRQQRQEWLIKQHRADQFELAMLFEIAKDEATMPWWSPEEWIVTNSKIQEEVAVEAREAETAVDTEAYKELLPLPPTPLAVGMERPELSVSDLTLLNMLAELYLKRSSAVEALALISRATRSLARASGYPPSSTPEDLDKLLPMDLIVKKGLCLIHLKQPDMRRILKEIVLEDSQAYGDLFFDIGTALLRIGRERGKGKVPPFKGLSSSNIDQPFVTTSYHYHQQTNSRIDDIPSIFPYSSTKLSLTVAEAAAEALPFLTPLPGHPDLDGPEIWIQLLTCYRRLGNGRRGVHLYYEQLQKMDPMHPKYLHAILTLAEECLKMNDRHRARQLAEEASQVAVAEQARLASAAASFHLGVPGISGYDENNSQASNNNGKKDDVKSYNSSSNVGVSSSNNMKGKNVLSENSREAVVSRLISLEELLTRRNRLLLALGLHHRFVAAVLPFVERDIRRIAMELEVTSSSDFDPALRKALLRKRMFFEKGGRKGAGAEESGAVFKGSVRRDRRSARTRAADVMAETSLRKAIERRFLSMEEASRAAALAKDPCCVFSTTSAEAASAAAEALFTESPFGGLLGKSVFSDSSRLNLLLELCDSMVVCKRTEDARELLNRCLEIVQNQSVWFVHGLGERLRSGLTCVTVADMSFASGSYIAMAKKKIDSELSDYNYNMIIGDDDDEGDDECDENDDDNNAVARKSNDLASEAKDQDGDVTMTEINAMNTKGRLKSYKSLVDANTVLHFSSVPKRNFYTKQDSPAAGFDSSFITKDLLSLRLSQWCIKDRELKKSIVIGTGAAWPLFYCPMERVFPTLRQLLGRWPSSFMLWGEFNRLALGSCINHPTGIGALGTLSPSASDKSMTRVPCADSAPVIKGGRPIVNGAHQEDLHHSGSLFIDDNHQHNSKYTHHSSSNGKLETFTVRQWVTVINNLRRQHPHSVPLMILQGNAQLMMRQCAAAASSYLQALPHIPHNALLLLCLAVSHLGEALIQSAQVATVCTHRQDDQPDKGEESGHSAGVGGEEEGLDGGDPIASAASRPRFYDRNRAILEAFTFLQEYGRRRGGGGAGLGGGFLGCLDFPVTSQLVETSFGNQSKRSVHKGEGGANYGDNMAKTHDGPMAQEVAYNMGRAFHQLGLHFLAERFYWRALNAAPADEALKSLHVAARREAKEERNEVAQEGKETIIQDGETLIQEHEKGSHHNNRSIHSATNKSAVKQNRIRDFQESSMPENGLKINNNQAYLSPLDLKRETAHNLALLYRASGSPELACLVLKKHFVI